MVWRIGVVVAILLVMYFLLRYARDVAPKRNEVLVGVDDGRLQPCPDTPNCVSSQAPQSDDHHVEPLPYSGTREEAHQTILAVIASAPRTHVVENRPDYIWAEYRTRVMRFVDDVEFYLPEEEKVVHFRSASRAGEGDLGVNRRRYDHIAAAFEAHVVH